MSDRNLMAKLVCCFVKHTSFISVNIALIDKMFKKFHMTHSLLRTTVCCVTLVIVVHLCNLFDFWSHSENIFVPVCSKEAAFVVIQVSKAGIAAEFAWGNL